MGGKSPDNQGFVSLVGAGPGDPGLLTRKGAAVLREADVIVYDYLANPELLLEAKPGAELVYVGMHSGERLSQDEINRLLVDRARQGKHVCRLKGGDPFVFARGGEEAEFVAASGIPWEVVPGVSAGYAVPAYAGIPLTHRQLASSVLFVTGHEDPEKDEVSLVDWDNVARSTATIVFFMGVKELPNIMDRLMRAGRRASTPAALIRWGTRGEQQAIAGTVGTLAGLVKDAGLKPPAIVVVGEVVALREKLRWFENLPLFGERILITRAREQAAELAAPLRALGAETIELPTIAIEDPQDWAPLDQALRSLHTYHWILFTSANGVRQFTCRMAETGIDIRRAAGAKLAAIGPATAEELRKHLLTVDKIPREYVAEGVLQAFEDEPLQGKRILIPRAKVARDVLPVEFSKLGAVVDVVEAYRAVIPADAAERARVIFSRHRPTVAVFTSSSTAENLFSLLSAGEGQHPLEGIQIACIGPITRRTVERRGLRVDIEPAEYTIPGLVAAITEWIGRKSAAAR